MMTFMLTCRTLKQILIIVESIELLRLWWCAYGGDKAPIKTVSIFEKHLLKMSSLKLYDFCQWEHRGGKEVLKEGGGRGQLQAWLHG